MKATIEAARERERRTADLANEARHAQERYDLCKAKIGTVDGEELV